SSDVCSSDLSESENVATAHRYREIATSLRAVIGQECGHSIQEKIGGVERTGVGTEITPVETDRTRSSCGNRKIRVSSIARLVSASVQHDGSRRSRSIHKATATIGIGEGPRSEE